MFVGSDVYSDGTARGQSKNIYEPGSNIINNWDVMEGVLDYCFIKLGVDGKNGSIDRPIVMTEPVANLGYTRKSTYDPNSKPRLITHIEGDLLTVSFFSHVGNPIRMLRRALCRIRH